MIVGACDPIPPGEGLFWSPRETVQVSGSGSVDAQSDLASPSDLADLGPDGGPSSGGSPGTGGDMGSGGDMGAAGISGSGGTSASGGNGAPGGAAGAGGQTGIGGDTGLLAAGTLKVTVTTKAAGGQYAPRNVGAVWIADSGTKFVKTLYLWAQRRRSYLSHWGSATSAAGLSNNVVDAVTGATLSNHGVRTATWDGTNTSKTPVPDGAYKVCFELCDGGTPQYQCVDFNKGRTAQTLKPADSSSFTMRSISYMP